MNDPERTHLLDLLTQTWPSGPKARVWSDVISELDHAHAHIAYMRMRDKVQRASVADFVRAYREVQDETTPRTQLVCTHCHGDGWIEAAPLVVTYKAGSRTYTQARPCPHCPAGEQVARAQREWERMQGRVGA